MPKTITAIEIIPGDSPDYGKEISGRCRRCNCRFLWPARLGKLKNMTCLFCGASLGSTTHLFKGKTYRMEER
jgi:hypothetical protein